MGQAGTGDLVLKTTAGGGEAELVRQKQEEIRERNSDSSVSKTTIGSD